MRSGSETRERLSSTADVDIVEGKVSGSDLVVVRGKGRSVAGDI